MLRRAQSPYGVLVGAYLFVSATAVADDEDVGMDFTGTLDEPASEQERADAAPDPKAPEAKASEAETSEAETEPTADVLPAQRRERNSSLGVGIDAYFDSGEQEVQRINSGGGNLVEGRTDMSNDGFLLGSDLALVVWWMTEIHDDVQLGAGLRLLGSYAYELDGGDTVKLGQTLELGPRAQYLLEITERLGITFGLEADLMLIFPGSDLSDRIDALDAQGFDTTGAPRLGFLIGPQIGVRYIGSEWIALRADLGWLWAKVFLVDATAESGGLRGEEQWTADWTRWRLHLGTELMF